MNNIRYHRKTMVEEVGNQLVDVMIMTMIRFHAKSAKDQADLLKLLSTGVSPEHLKIILPRFDARQEFQAISFDVNRWGDGEYDQAPTLTATVNFSKDGPMWTIGSLFDTKTRLPDVMANALIGEPLCRLVTHPYLPTDLVIRQMECLQIGWSAKFHSSSEG